MKKLILIGAANAELAKLVRAINGRAPTWELVGYLDDDPAKQGTMFMDAPVLGPTSQLASDRHADVSVLTAIGAPAIRRKMAGLLEQAGCEVASLIHPGVDLWGVGIAPGCIVFERATISPNVTVGAHSLISFLTFLGHDVTVGSFCNVAPNATISGRCVIGDEVYIGAGATLLPKVQIGDGAVVAAGAVVTRNVKPKSTVVGNPARVMLQM